VAMSSADEHQILDNRSVVRHLPHRCRGAFLSPSAGRTFRSDWPDGTGTGRARPAISGGGKTGGRRRYGSHQAHPNATRAASCARGCGPRKPPTAAANKFSAGIIRSTRAKLCHA
jgi:hypothetical protein